MDVGDARVGVARVASGTSIATPVETAPRSAAAAIVAEHAADMSVTEIIVGLPRRLAGDLGPAAQKALAFCAELHQALAQRDVDVPIRLFDERLTTVQAHGALHRSGRKERTHRSVVDQVAAVLILQAALDRERSTGLRAGIPYPLEKEG